jgi:hypothetical protein
MIQVARQDVPDPLSVWRDYARQHPLTLRDYDLADSGQPNLLTADEAWRSRRINSRITHAECDALERLALQAPWHTVSANADLADADPEQPDGLFAAAAAIYWHFTWPERTPGIGVAKVHKVLHPKRPGLYPILDDRLRHLYSGCAARWIEPLAHLGELTPADSPPYWAAIREDLNRCRDDLEAHRDSLRCDDDETVRRLADLTNVRLLDIVAWSIAAVP